MSETTTADESRSTEENKSDDDNEVEGGEVVFDTEENESGERR